MSISSNEASIILALQALGRNENLSVRRVVEIYKVCDRTLGRRRAGMPARRDILANSRKLTDLEEKTIVQYITELCARAFNPRLCYVEDMANRLLCERDVPPVGKCWAHNFIKRQPDLQTCFSRKYDY